MADLQVRVAADVASAISALQKLEKELDRAKLGAEETARSTDNASKALSRLPSSPSYTIYPTNLMIIYHF